MPVGILLGLIAGAAYNRWSTIQLPSVFGLLCGTPLRADRDGLPRRFGCTGIRLGWPWLATGIDAISHVVTSAGAFGLFLYGFLNRLLIVTGLHHISTTSSGSC
jgi:PTS system N-acetylglucosamine-specific IIC component